MIAIDYCGSGLGSLADRLLCVCHWFVDNVLLRVVYMSESRCACLIVSRSALLGKALTFTKVAHRENKQGTTEQRKNLNLGLNKK